jgi:hypothetical protein
MPYSWISARMFVLGPAVVDDDHDGRQAQFGHLRRGDADRRACGQAGYVLPREPEEEQGLAESCPAACLDHGFGSQIRYRPHPRQARWT